MSLILTALPAAGSASSSVNHWVLKKNCSFTPRQVVLFFLSLTAASLVIAGYFVMRGLWLVLPFAILYDATLAMALIAYARHALDRECVSLVGDTLRVDVIRGSSVTRYEFNAHWVRCKWGGRRNEFLWLGHGSKYVPVGTYLTPQRRRRFAREFQAAVQQCRAATISPERD